MAKNYMGENSLRALTRLIKESLTTINTSLETKVTEEKVNELITAAITGGLKTSDIVNTLTSESDDKVLAASQGKILDEKITVVDTKITSTTTKVTEIGTKLDAIDADGDNVVDEAANAAALEGHKAEYFAKATDLEGYIAASEKGVADGVVPLDSSGQIASQYLPSYVDDVIEGSLTGDGNGWNTNPGFSDNQVVEGEKGKIYVDITTNKSYRWSGSLFVEIVSDDLVEITAAEVEAMWNSIT